MSISNVVDTMQMRSSKMNIFMKVRKKMNKLLRMAELLCFSLKCHLACLFCCGTLTLTIVLMIQSFFVVDYVDSNDSNDDSHCNKIVFFCNIAAVC